MTIINLPSAEKPDDLLIGPFTVYKVQVEGRIIPRLTGHPQEDGQVTLIVDGRFAVDFPAEVANQAAWLLANALAVGEGYAHLGAPNKDRSFAPRGAQLGDGQ